MSNWTRKTKLFFSEIYPTFDDSALPVSSMYVLPDKGEEIDHCQDSSTYSVYSNGATARFDQLLPTHQQQIQLQRQLVQEWLESKQQPSYLLWIISVNVNICNTVFT